jgi:hypothetical protein
MLLEDYVDTIVEALGRVGRFEVEDQTIWSEVTGGRRRAEIVLTRANVPRNRQATLTIEVSWEPTHTFLYQLEELVADNGDEEARTAVYEALQGHERFCVDLVYSIDVEPDASQDAVNQFLALLEERGISGATQVQVSWPVENAVRDRRPQAIRVTAHLHDTAYEHRISFGYFLDAIIGNLRHLDECRQLTGI